VRAQMKKITVRIHDRELRRLIEVKGYRVKIGVVDNEFAATSTTPGVRVQVRTL
jgi:hypothetical protein